MDLRWVTCVFGTCLDYWGDGVALFLWCVHGVISKIPTAEPLTVAVMMIYVNRHLTVTVALTLTRTTTLTVTLAPP